MAAAAMKTSAHTSVQSYQVRTSSVDWHVCETGQGPVLLLLHGTGSSVHSWRELMPLLATDYRVVAVDLPGHGRSRLIDEQAVSLEGMTAALGEFLVAQELTVQVAIGHSAGAALAAQAVLSGALNCAQIFSINGAFVPFGGAAGQLFAPLARALAGSGWVAGFIARRARDPRSVERLLASTGSQIDDTYMDGYRELFATPDHVAATLSMMANWDLWGLQRDLPALEVPVVLMVAERDMTVPPPQAMDTQARLADAQIVRLGPLGHLAHEENAPLVHEAILANVLTGAME
ncbi:MAG: alpha/beta fold hydrolase BchO [Gammaproteobacteria bacterium]